MNITRVFHPVGQGGFFTEKVAGFRVAYDCGSVTSLTALHDQIDMFSDEIFDVLFISHFDTDHVNGLVYFLENLTVKKVILPLIHYDERIRLAVKYHRSRTCKFMSDFCIDPAGFIKRICREAEKEIEVVFVAPYGAEPNDNDIERDLDGANHRVISSGTSVPLSNTEIPWVFVPHNFDGENRSEEALILLAEADIHIGTPQEFKELWADKETRRSIVKAFKDVKGDPNTNSLALYSGPEDEGSDHRVWDSLLIQKSKLLPISGGHFQPGCIYLGDYDCQGPLKWKQLNEGFSVYWKYVGTVQIPHHGSKHNDNESLYSDSRPFCVIASGVDNRHKHPHVDTLKNIISNHGIPLWVNENEESGCLFFIRIADSHQT
ncbi:hypothetical protein ACMXYO_08625 [Neptuniibacter sp. QD37_6]|uniref:hypothetical protein n=1 Tax=Neptuniibacter sp. QD37_6 TaxID=3398210 RepID=UPI0039F5B399